MEDSIAFSGVISQLSDGGFAPQHKVTLTAGFYMGSYPVTNNQWRKVMGKNPTRRQWSELVMGDAGNYIEVKMDDYTSYYKDDLPVINVSWYEAVEFCNRLSVWEGLEPVYVISNITQPTGFYGMPSSVTESWAAGVTMVAGANGYRLPTEAEWEYACRAGTTTLWNTGDSITVEQANFNNYPLVSIGHLPPITNVGSFEPNAWGLYDMHGNVREWCWDRFDPYSYFGVQSYLDQSKIFAAIHESYTNKIKVYSDTVAWNQYFTVMDNFFYYQYKKETAPSDWALDALEATKQTIESEFGGIPDSLYEGYVAERKSFYESFFDYYKNQERVDPTGPVDPARPGNDPRVSVVRGGSWDLNDLHMCSAYRSGGWVLASDKRNFAGFRVVRNK